MRLIRTAIEQPITVAVGVILSILAGLVALDRVPIAMAPEVEDTVISVATTWENASPQEVETEIVDEQEERLQGVTNLRSMTSISQRGMGQIRLEFRTGTEIETAMREVSDKLREVPSYPENVDEPVVEDTDPESRDYIAWICLASSDPDFDVTTLYDFVDKRIKPRYERLPGVAEVGILGGREREVQIRIDPYLLAQRQITIAELFSALQATNENFSGGALAEGKSDVRVRAIGRFSSAQQALDTVIRQDDSGPVYIRDVAEVSETYKEADSLVTARGVPVVAVNFLRELGSNSLEVMSGIKAETDRLNAPGGLLDLEAQSLNLEGSLELVQTYDQTEYIDQALELVRSNIVLGGAIAVFTLLLFLRSLRSIGIIAIAIPISVIGSVVVLVALGRTVNVVSLAGMAFAVGMVVDNSIVVIENIYRHLEMGKKRARAALDGASEVAGAVLASSLTTLVVFVPILLIQETAGQLFRDIALAICAAVALSFCVSITVIPSAAALILRPQVKKAGHETWCDKCPDDPPLTYSAKLAGRLIQAICRVQRLGSALPRAVGRMVYALSGSLSLRLGVAAVFVAVALLGSYLLMPPMDYLPSGNRNIIFGILIPPPGYNLAQLTRLKDRLQSRTNAFWEAAPDAFTQEEALRQRNGLEGTPDLFPVSLEPEPGSVVPPSMRQYFVVAVDGGMFHAAISDDPERTVDLLPLFQHAAAPEAVPGVLSFAFQLPIFRTGGTTGSAVKIDLAGSDLGRVSDSAGALFARLAQQFGPYSIQPEPSNFNIMSPEMQVIPDLIRLTDTGLTVRDLGLTVQANADGAFVGEFESQGELIDLKVIAKDAVDQTSMFGFADVPMATPTGAIVNMGSVADLVRVVEPDQIKRVGRQRAVTLQFTPPPGLPLQQAIDQVNQMIAELKSSEQISPDVQTFLAGSASKLDEIRTALIGDGTLLGILRSSLFLAFLVVYLLMCVLFQSWTYPFVIMFSVPLATFGGFLALAGVHAWSQADRYMPVQNLDVLTILGFVILAGVVVNNAILIVHQSLNLMTGRFSDAQGNTPTLPAREAISKAVESRVRPILMSTLTSVGGMLPLVLSPGSGSELYRGLGTVVVGGLSVSTVFTLVLVPVLLSLLMDLSSFLKRRRGRDELMAEAARA